MHTSLHTISCLSMPYYALQQIPQHVWALIFMESLSGHWPMMIQGCIKGSCGQCIKAKMKTLSWNRIPFGRNLIAILLPWMESCHKERGRKSSRVWERKCEKNESLCNRVWEEMERRESLWIKDMYQQGFYFYFPIQKGTLNQLGTCKVLKTQQNANVVIEV